MRWTAVETFLDTADAWVDGRAEGADVVWAAGDAGLLLTAVPARRELDDLLVQAVGRPLVVASTDDDAGKAVLFAVGDLTRAVRLDDVDPDVTVLTCGTLHPVAGAQQDHIPWHKIGRRYVLPAAFPQHGRLWSQHGADGRQGALGPPLLDQSDRGVDYHHTEDYRGVEPVAKHGGDHGRSKQHQDQRAVELVQHTPQQAARWYRRQCVWTM